MSSPIPFLRIRAKDHADFGYQLGKKLAKQIKRRVRANKHAYRKRGAKNFKELITAAEQFLPSIRKHFPHLIDELMGISAGANVPFGELLVVNCEEEVLNYYIPHCTSLGLKTDSGDILIGHNDDWLPEYAKNGMYLVEGNLNGHSFLALSYMGSLPGTACGINSSGLGFTVNSLFSKRFRIGVPRIFLLRQLLETGTLSDASKVLRSDWASICANTLLATDERMEDIETLWGHRETFESKRWLIHTNHPLEKEYQNGYNTEKESVKRTERAQSILSKARKRDLKILRKVLRDHETQICGHKGKGVLGITIASAILNPEEQWMMVCHGYPCKGKYRKYWLKKRKRLKTKSR